MIQIFVNTSYDFVGKRRWFYLASLAAVVLSLLSIAAHRGLNYGIDFTGGTLIQVRFEKPTTVAAVRRGLDEIKLGSAVIQQFGDAQEYLIRLAETDQKGGDIGPRVQAALGTGEGGKAEI